MHHLHHMLKGCEDISWIALEATLSAYNTVWELSAGAQISRHVAISTPDNAMSSGYFPLLARSYGSHQV
jgi:hypothetical protein